MLRLLFAVLVFWALSTSGIRASDVVQALAVWTADHVEVSVRAPDRDSAQKTSDPRRDGTIDLGPFTLGTTD